MLVSASASQPPELEAEYNQRLHGPDQGIINAWLAGRQLGKNNPDLVQQAQSGELPPLPFKGGIEKKIKAQNKIGSLWYVAALQGLKGCDLSIETDQEIRLICSKTKVPVTYTLAIDKLFSKAAE